MATTEHPRTELATRAQAIYDAELRHKVEPQEIDRYLALDVETRDYEIADSLIDASVRLRERRPPPAAFFAFRIGHRAARKLGGHIGGRL